MKVAANLSMMFQEVGGLLGRYDAAAAAGFGYVECAFPYTESKQTLADKLHTHKLQQVLINAPPGSADAGGGFGMACIPSLETQFKESINLAIDYAKALHCPRIHVMAGKSDSSTLRVTQETTYVNNIRFAAELMSKEGITCLIEPINAYSVPGYFLCSYDQAIGYIQQINLPNLKLQFDVFHCQLLRGNITNAIKQFMPHIGHVQIAQAPDRHEPDSPGEINYPYVFETLQKEGYEGYIGAEYKPAGYTDQALQWITNNQTFLQMK